MEGAPTSLERFAGLKSGGSETDTHRSLASIATLSRIPPSRAINCTAAVRSSVAETRDVVVAQEMAHPAVASPAGAPSWSTNVVMRQSIACRRA